MTRLRRLLCRLGLACPHKWRPAVERMRIIGGEAVSPIRLCDLCGREESLTPAEFYAYFGRMPW